MMPSGKHLSKEVDEAVAKDYVSGLLSLNQIARKYNIGIRTIYNCIDRCVPRISAKKATDLLVVKLTRNEVELALLLILEMGDSIQKGNEFTLQSLEEKLLTAADRDERNKRLQ